MMANPVLSKEIRTRLRSKKARKVQLAIGIPAGIVVFVSYGRLLLALFRFHDLEGEVWLGCSMLQLAIISFLTPGLLANAITQEKEQRTWGLLRITRLSSWQIISGKLIARLLPIPILMVLFAPFMVYSAVSSAMKWPVIAGTYAVLISAVLLFAVQALFWSTTLKKTSTAIAASYGLVFLATIGTYIVDQLIEVTTRISSPTSLLWCNPFYVMADFMVKLNGYQIPRPVMQEIIVFFSIYVAGSVVLLAVTDVALERIQAD
ncbi:MAG TPA: hypothetical protein VFI02_07685 [Armatimonadota bacterium]|nr:hypothetical protein [Armatimonadota bacterium]